MEEQTAALRLSLDTTMQQTVEVALNFTPNNSTLPSEILDAIAIHIRLTLYRLSGQIFSEGFSVGLACATPPDARDMKTQLPKVLGGCFLWIPPAEFGAVLKETSLSIRQSGVKLSGLHKQPFPKKFIFSCRDIHVPTDGSKWKSLPAFP